MGAYISPILFGRPRKELSFTANIDELQDMSQAIGSVEKRVRNASGESFRRVFRKQSASFRVRNGFPVSDALKAKLESLRLIADEPLSFVFADDWPIYSDRYTLETTTTFKLSSSPYTRLGTAYKAAGGGDADIIKFTPTGGGVFADYDVGGAQVSADFFSSYAAATRTVTINTPLAIGTVVYANWFYRGAEVLLSDMRHRNRGGHVNAGLPLWDISLRLDGV